MNAEQAAALRAPFPPSEVGKLRLALRLANLRRESAAALTTAEAALAFADAHPDRLTPELREATDTYRAFLTEMETAHGQTY